MITDVKPTIVGLSSIFRELINAHKRLSACALELRDALVACDHELIERLTKENERISAEVRRLENKRISFLRETGIDDNRAASFSALEEVLAGVQLTEDEQKAFEDLKDLRAELAKEIHQADHHNQLNLTLAGQALEFHEFCLQLLMNASSGDVTGYTPKGPSRPEKDTSFIDGLA